MTRARVTDQAGRIWVLYDRGELEDTAVWVSGCCVWVHEGKETLHVPAGDLPCHHRRIWREYMEVDGVRAGFRSDIGPNGMVRPRAAQATGRDDHPWTLAIVEIHLGTIIQMGDVADAPDVTVLPCTEPQAKLARVALAASEYVMARYLMTTTERRVQYPNRSPHWRAANERATANAEKVTAEGVTLNDLDELWNVSLLAGRRDSSAFSIGNVRHRAAEWVSGLELCEGDEDQQAAAELDRILSGE